MSEQLIQAIRAAIDEDERIAVMAAMRPGEETWQTSVRNGPESIRAESGIHIASYVANEHRPHIVRHDPVRVLRQVAAHRKILDAHPMDSMPRWRPWCTTCHDETVDYPCDTIAALAEAYGIDPAEQT